jgi:hypothetical protein
MNDQDWVDLLREAHQEPIDPAHYAAVRARVLAELGRERRPFCRWAWVGGSAAAVVVLAMLTPKPRPVGQALRPAIVAEATAPVYGPAAPRVSERQAPVHRRHRTVAQARQEGRPNGLPHNEEPVVIKLLTDDPNVVIYWIGE